MIHHRLHTDASFAAQVSFGANAMVPAKARPRGTVAAAMAKVPRPPAEPPSAKLQQKHHGVAGVHGEVTNNDDVGVHHGVAEVKTDGVGENEQGQVKDLSAIRFKDLNLWLEKPVFKLWLQQTLCIPADGHVMKYWEPGLCIPHVIVYTPCTKGGKVCI